jgi:cysteine-S-conjugate beta-lyase
MKYDFDRICDRKNTNCSKWDAAASIFGSDEVIPMWVADMDFPAAQPIVDALKKRAEHEFYGYTRAGDSVIDAVVDRMKRKFNWKIMPEWVVFTPGVIPALSLAVRTLTHPGDEIVLQPPVYYPFFPVVTNSGCQIVNNRLKFSDGKYFMDFDDLEQKFHPKMGMHPTPSRIKAIILCNPQNPIGRLWTKEELIRLGEIALKNNAVVVSDEIHCEILYRGYQHTPFASISKEFAENSIVCMAPSKTFNLAGLETSSIIIPNSKLRATYTSLMTGITPGPNLFGFTALEAAYRHGDEWLEQVLDYIQKNLDFTLDYFKTNIPRIKVIHPQGTYLIWLDCRDLKLDNKELQRFMRLKAKVGFDDGFLFGAGGDGFQRMNIACPMHLLKEALDRIKDAVNSVS